MECLRLGIIVIIMCSKCLYDHIYAKLVVYSAMFFFLLCVWYVE